MTAGDWLGLCGWESVLTGQLGGWWLSAAPAPPISSALETLSSKPQCTPDLASLRTLHSPSSVAGEGDLALLALPLIGKRLLPRGHMLGPVWGFVLVCSFRLWFDSVQACPGLQASLSACLHRRSVSQQPGPGHRRPRRRPSLGCHRDLFSTGPLVLQPSFLN